MFKFYTNNNDYVLQYSNLKRNYDFINNFYDLNGTLSVNENEYLNEVLQQQTTIVSNFKLVFSQK